jgi:hypothetical protein
METGEVVPKNPSTPIKILERIDSQTGNAFHIIPKQTDMFSRLIIILMINFERI